MAVVFELGWETGVVVMTLVPLCGDVGEVWFDVVISEELPPEGTVVIVTLDVVISDEVFVADVVTSVVLLNGTIVTSVVFCIT